MPYSPQLYSACCDIGRQTIKGGADGLLWTFHHFYFSGMTKIIVPINLDPRRSIVSSIRTSVSIIDQLIFKNFGGPKLK
jgi:hypothetical protein